MSREINIAVKSKIAVQTDETVYVCGNTDYTVVFDFDGDWADLAVKTARFRYNGTHQDIVFNGDRCPMPQISNTHIIKVGVFAGDLHTTTPALVSARKSILCGSSVPEAPTDDVYNQIMERLNDIEAENTKEMGGVKIEIESVQQDLMNSSNTANKEFETLRKDLDELRADFEYVPIDITGISNNVGTVETGTAVNEVTVSWTINKTPVSQTVNGEAVDVDKRSVVLPVDGTYTFTVKATDERDATDTASTSIGFLNGVYYGVLADGVTIDRAAVLGLTRKLQGSSAITFTANAADGQRIAYAFPARYGTPVFYVGGFEGGFSPAEHFEFENASGYKEQYAVWLSDNTGLGSTKVEVK